MIAVRPLALIVAIGMCLACESHAALTADTSLHLEDHLDAATLVGSEVPASPMPPVEWRFDEPQPDWMPVSPRLGGLDPLEVTTHESGLRLSLTERNRIADATDGRLWGSLAIELPGYRLADWTTVLVRARTADLVGDVGVHFNLYEREDRRLGLAASAMPLDSRAPVFSDGSVHTYAFRTDRLYIPDRRFDAGLGGDSGRAGSRDLSQPLRQLALYVSARGPASIDLLSVTLVPAEAAYADAPVGVRTEVQGATHRRALYMHAPGRLEYTVGVPRNGRLDVALGVVRPAPVRFRVSAVAANGETVTLLEETQDDPRGWALHSVDLSDMAGRVVTLALEIEADRDGAVGLWGAPTISGERASDDPNVIFYVIDAGAADHMSVYGYNRRTTPNLDRLAAEGAVFDRAYSNSTHTSASTPSFATSLHTSVLGVHEGARLIPEEQVSMAEFLHGAGYQTALLTSNPHAGWYSGLERGFDMVRDAVLIDGDSTSSVPLQRDYWQWRAAWAGEPYFVHLQTTDVHAPWSPGPPFTGLFLRADLREKHSAISSLRWKLRDRVPLSTILAEAGVDPAVHHEALSALYDEAMAHQDFQIGQLVRRLKELGEWERTLLIVAADHSQRAGGLWDPSGSAYDPMFRSSVTRVPLLVFWPGRIEGGQRFRQTVSMIDVLPTVLDLVGLPESEVAQGQSLAPLLLGEDGWVQRPVVLDEFEIDAETGELTGVIEVIDGRWGASLLIKPRADAWPESQRDAPLLLYDLWSDPHTLRSVNEERPDLVDKYTAFLEERFRTHRALAERFTRSDPAAMSPEQLRALRALGYIQ